MDAGTSTRLPQQRDSRAELAALAHAISTQVDGRRAPAPVDARAEPARAATEVAARAPRRLPARVGIASALVVAAVPAVALLWPHGSVTRPAAPARHTTAAARVTGPPLSPAATMGAQAAKALSRADRPVTAYGCQAAYDADVPRSGGILPPRSHSSTQYDDYMRGCLSGMS